MATRNPVTLEHMEDLLDRVLALNSDERGAYMSGGSSHPVYEEIDDVFLTAVRAGVLAEGPRGYRLTVRPPISYKRRVVESWNPWVILWLLVKYMRRAKRYEHAIPR